ncbi:ribonuclease H-like domain-containing protein [Daedaleopsis nitida]|nr:ribonuclease H-like domain-containing protein [Daedaleopsis nitida]
MPSASHHEFLAAGEWSSTRSYRPEPASVARAKQAGARCLDCHCIHPTTRPPPQSHLSDAAAPRIFWHRWLPVHPRRPLRTPLANLKTVAIYTDGACSDNGATATDGSNRTPRGGFIFKSGSPETVSFALEEEGPYGEVYRHTSNRAELRAALAALQFRAWGGEGWERVVIITDSDYVGNHATASLRKWAARGWLTSSNEPIKNQDLWKALSERIGELATKEGCEVAFWTVPRTWNSEADARAKAAVTEASYKEFTRIGGVAV